MTSPLFSFSTTTTLIGLPQILPGFFYVSHRPSFLNLADIKSLCKRFGTIAHCTGLELSASRPSSFVRMNTLRSITQRAAKLPSLSCRIPAVLPCLLPFLCVCCEIAAKRSRMMGKEENDRSGWGKAFPPLTHSLILPPAICRQR